MKIGELVQKTGVAKETIHFYIREGLLRKPRKQGKNTAVYNENHVEHIRIIKDLRDNYFLPLPLIKKIFRRLKKQTPLDRDIDRLHNKYFRPLDRMLTADIEGRDAFIHATGLKEKWLEKMETWGVITPESRNGRTIYSHDNVIIAKLILDMGRFGLGVRDGYDPEMLRYLSEMFKEIFDRGAAEFLNAHSGKIPKAEMAEKAVIASEIMGIFYYLLYRKLSNDQRRLRETDNGSR